MIKPIYLVWDDEAQRYSHNTNRDIGIYSSKAEEFFSRADLETAYYEGYFDGVNEYNYEHEFVTDENLPERVDKLIEHDGKPYKESKK